MGRQGILDAYRTGRGSIRLRGMAEIEEGPRNDRIVVTDAALPGEPRTSSSPRSRSWSTTASSTGIADLNDESAGKSEHAPRDQAQARRAGPRHPQQPLQAHAAADELRGEHGGPGRRRAPHAQPARRAAWPTSSTRSRSSPAAREFRLDKAEGPGPHRRGPAQGARPDRRRSSPPSGPRADTPAAREAPDGRRRSSSARCRPSTSSTCSCRRLTRLGRADLEEELAELRETIAELEAILGRRGQAPRRSSSDELGEVREKYAQPPRLADHLRRRRPRHRGPHRRRGPRRHHDGQGLHQDRRGRRLPHPGPRRPGRGRRQAARTRTTSTTSSTPRPTPTCCSSRTGAGCTA